jgi:hypothetical protein
MDLRTMVRELDEVITRTRSATERETAHLNALPCCGQRRRKQQQVRAMRDHLHRLQSLRSGVRTRRRPGSWLR